MATKSLGKLVAFLGLDTKNWTGGFASAQKTASTFAGKINSTLTRVGTGILSFEGAAAAGAGAAAVAFHKVAESMNTIDRQAKLADRLGITVGSVQKLSLAADLAGTDVEVLAKAMLKMGKNIGSGGMPLDKRLFQTADAIAKIGDAGVRAKKAEAIFGKGGLELINVLTQGGRGIRQSADAIDKFGLALSRMDAANVEEANDAFTELKTVLDGFWNKISVEIAPGLSTFFKDQTNDIGNLILAYGRLRGAVESVFPGVIGAYMRGAGGALPNLALPLIPGGGLLGLGRVGAKAMALGQGGEGAAGALGGLGTASGGTAGARFANPLMRGSIEAASAITKAGGNPMVDAVKPVVDKLTLIERHTAAAARKESRTPLRPSALHGGGVK